MPGLSSLRRQVATLRVLLVVALVLLVVIGVWSIVGVASLTSQVETLEAKVDRNAAIAAQSVPTTPADAAREASPEPKQVAAAASLPEGTILPGGVDASGAVLVGDPNATRVVEVFVDYQCPFCQRWESEIGSALMAKAVQPGSDLLVKQYNLAFLKESSPTLDPPGASARAASAAACVIAGDGAAVFADFNAAVFASADPSEPPTQFATEALADLASSLGASDETIACIKKQEFLPFIAATTQASFARGVSGTPTVTINGEAVQSSFDDPALLALIQG